MKKIFIFAIAAMLCFSALIPVSALEVDGKEFDLPNWDKTEYPYYFIYKSTIPTTRYVLIISKTDFDVREIDSITYVYYTGEELTWKLNSSTEFNNISLDIAQRVNLSSNPCVYANTNLQYEDGTIFYESNVIITECDGSSCPANDIDKNNICDDCGNVLTMSLRSTLYDYVVDYTDRYVNNEEQYTYRIIVQDNDNQYSVYLSTTPAVYNSASNELTFSDGKQTFVTQQSDGTNKGDGWAILTKVSNALTIRENIVFANYDIENFFPIPLWEEMDNLTRGEMETVRPNLVGTLMILMACGVGCLALLVVLKLFGKRSLIYRK